VKFLRYIVPALVLVLSVNSLVLAADAGVLPKYPVGKLSVLQLPEWPVNSSAYGGKLLLSDSPEMVTDDGIMYQDTVEGDARLFFHHVNSTSTPKKIIVMLENSGDEPVNITVYQHGLGGPGYDYLAVGKKAQMDYLNGGELYIVEVPAHGTAELAPALSNTVVENNMLVNGIYDFKTDRPVKVSTMMMPVDANVKAFAAQAKVLPADQQRLRGTFEHKDRMLVPDKAYSVKQDGTVVITLADHKIDKYVTGIDATDGSQVLNYGNYGIVYKLYVPSAFDGKVAYHLNPRGGDYAGGIGVRYQNRDHSVVPTPELSTSFGANTEKDIAFIGSFDGGQSVWLTFSPPGASNLPVKLLITPDKSKL